MKKSGLRPQKHKAITPQPPLHRQAPPLAMAPYDPDQGASLSHVAVRVPPTYSPRPWKMNRSADAGRPPGGASGMTRGARRTFPPPPRPSSGTMSHLKTFAKPARAFFRLRAMSFPPWLAAAGVIVTSGHSKNQKALTWPVVVDDFNSCPWGAVPHQISHGHSGWSLGVILRPRGLAIRANNAPNASLST